MLGLRILLSDIYVNLSFFYIDSKYISFISLTKTAIGFDGFSRLQTSVFEGTNA